MSKEGGGKDGGKAERREGLGTRLLMRLVHGHFLLFSALDFEECAEEPCEHICNNTRGSFECLCMAGFELNDDERQCDSE